MKRRSFLQRAGLLVAGGTGVLAAERRSAEAAEGEASERSPPPGRPKAVLLTTAECQLARVLARELGSRYRLRLTGETGLRGDFQWMRTDLADDAAADALVRGMDAIVHLAQPPADAAAANRMDHRTRLTYNLLNAASRQHVRLLIYLSSLTVFAGCPKGFIIDGQWRPSPTSDAEPLSFHLGEFICREFAREASLRVIVLRLGTVIRAEEVQGRPHDPLWVDERDVCQAVSRSVDLGLDYESTGFGAWNVFHILSGSPPASFSAAKARDTLGYQPRFKW